MRLAIAQIVVDLERIDCDCYSTHSYCSANESTQQQALPVRRSSTFKVIDHEAKFATSNIVPSPANAGFGGQFHEIEDSDSDHGTLGGEQILCAACSSANDTGIAGCSVLPKSNLDGCTVMIIGNAILKSST